MADILDQIQQQELAAENAGLAAAQHNLSWAQTFNSIPPAEKLRATRNLEDQVATALERRRSLAAQVDEKAQRIYYNAKKFEHELEQEPLRKDLLEAQIEHERASTAAIGLAQRTKQADEIADMKDLAAFNEEIAAIQYQEGTPEYIRELSRVAVKRPRALTTTAGREIFQSKSARHKSIAEIRSQIPDDMEVDEVNFDGEKFRVSTKPRAQEFATPEEAQKFYGENATVRQNARGKWSASIKPVGDSDLRSLERERALHVSMLGRAKRIRAKATDENVIKDADSDIMESDAALANIESQIRALRGGAPVTPPAPANDILEQARKAIAAGAPPDVVKERLSKLGGDPSKL